LDGPQLLASIAASHHTYYASSYREVGYLGLLSVDVVVKWPWWRFQSSASNTVLQQGYLGPKCEAQGSDISCLLLFFTRNFLLLPDNVHFGQTILTGAHMQKESLHFFLSSAY
jgi:hypothetical protein